MIAKSFAKKTVPIVAFGEVFGVLGKSLSKSANREEKVERSRIALERLVRIGAYFAGLHFLTKGKKNVFWVLFSSGLVQLVSQAFSWNLSLYFAIKSSFDLLGKRRFSFHLHPAFIYFTHFLHNDLLVNKAEWVEPSYIKLWLRTINGYGSYSSWLAHFSSTSGSRYAQEQVGLVRVSTILKKVSSSLFLNLPFVTVLYMVPHLISARKTIQKQFSSSQTAFYFVHSQLVRILRTATVLSILPYTLTEFPCIYDVAVKEVRQIQKTETSKTEINTKEEKPPRKVPILHALVTAVPTTAAFLLEPQPRLNVIMAYTWWRIIEAWVRVKTHFKEKDNKVLSFLAVAFMGVAAGIHSKSLQKST